MKKISIGDVFYECGGAFDSTKKIICNNKNIELIKKYVGKWYFVDYETADKKTKNCHIDYDEHYIL